MGVDVDPESPEWTIARTLKQHARALLGPKANRVSADLIAREITGALRMSNWRLIRIPPRSNLRQVAPMRCERRSFAADSKSAQPSRTCWLRCSEPGIRTSKEPSTCP